MHHIKANPWSPAMLEDAIDPTYDVISARRAVRSGKESL
jgi:hypothetical protein